MTCPAEYVLQQATLKAGPDGPAFAFLGSASMPAKKFYGKTFSPAAPSPTLEQLNGPGHEKGRSMAAQKSFTVKLFQSAVSFARKP